MPELCFQTQSWQTFLCCHIFCQDDHSNPLSYFLTFLLMKIRFVLQPFSFVFLLSVDQQYHVILETLDTEEATYIWHTDKNRPALMETIKHINSELNIIREKGRQAYLETNPANFSRVIHDYSDNRKGFIVWKGYLEERLV